MECHSKWNLSQHGMSLKLECHSNWNVIQIWCQSNWNVTQIKCHSNINVTQFGKSLKLECHSNWNVTQIKMLLKLECHPNWNVTLIWISLKLEIEKVVNQLGAVGMMPYTIKERAGVLETARAKFTDRGRVSVTGAAPALPEIWSSVINPFHKTLHDQPYKKFRPFYHGPDISRAMVNYWSCGHPVGGWLMRN